MPSISPPPNWSKKPNFRWTSPQGLEKLANIIAPSLPFVPTLWQLECSARLLDGQDVFCLSATGDGKSALMYIPALARPGSIALVVSPTNYLESDMVRDLYSDISNITEYVDRFEASEAKEYPH